MPFKPGEREYRSFSNMINIQETDSNAGYIVEGYATTFDVPYDMGWCNECVKRDALIGADMSDVIFQLNHEGQTLARQRTNTLQLEVDDHGLKVRADLGGSQSGRELYEAIKNGLIDRMSWGFMVPDDGWYFDEATQTSYITKISKVFDVSAVSIPANQDTEIHARSYLNGVKEREQQELLRRKQEERLRMAAILELTSIE